MGSLRHKPVLMVLVVAALTIASINIDPNNDGAALKYLDVVEGSNVGQGRIRELVNLGDLDQDGYDDIAITFPEMDFNGPDSGSVAIFWGDKGGFPDLDMENADLLIHGETNSLFGHSIAAWDQAGNGWKDLVIGAPNAHNGSGAVYLFGSNKVNGATTGSVFTANWADIEINVTESYFFGSEMNVGAMSNDEEEDLMILSFGDPDVHAKAAFYLGGITPDRPYEIMIKNGSVNNKTRSISLDLYGKGYDSFIYSSPDRGSLTVINMEVTEDAISIPGTNSTGVVDFNGSIEEQGNTWGWNAGDDGWDTSPYHIYDLDSGDDYVRWNQASGNPRGHDRSVENIGKLFIEVGGDLGDSGGTDQSGAYGVSFSLTSQNITDSSSATLSFDYEWENWGFEDNERMWIKSRFWDSTGDVTWLGKNVDTDVQNDATPEIFTMKGVNGGGGAGREIFGRGSFETDILPLIDGPGDYYLDLGGKISRWTQPNEFGGFGFDNISLILRTTDHDLREITGSGQLGTDLSAADVNNDGNVDLIVSSPQEGLIRIFNGSEPYWLTKVVNQGDCNYTIQGNPGTDFGHRLLISPPSPFLPNEALLVSQLQSGGDLNGSGVVHRFILPLDNALTTLDDVIESNLHPEGVYEFGMETLSIGDQDGNGYPELLLFGWNATSNLVYVRCDGSPSPPELSILFPKRHATVFGATSIKVSIYDVDGDARAEDVRFYRSIDNRSWIPVGDGTPDRVEGNIAIKDWDTKQFENTGYFFRITAEDDFGLNSVLYTDRIDVFNHAPPFVDLTQPSDGNEIRGNQQISARITVPSDEELALPVRFSYTRDNQTWVEFGNRSSPSGSSSVDYTIVLDTQELEDGEIWFKVNATTVFGLSREDRNIDPVIINNYYYPDVNITDPISNTTLNGIVKIIAVVTDIDDDLAEPVTFNIKKADDELFDFVANMTYEGNNTYSYLWNTTSVENGYYDLMVQAEDMTFLQTQGVMNNSVRVLNMYAPSIQLKGLAKGDTISSLWTFTATINDRDMNFRARDVSFQYSPSGEDNWVNLDVPVLTDKTAKVSWDTTSVMNGDIDIRVTVTDSDNLSSTDRINGIRVKNPYKPVISPSLPDPDVALKGLIRLNFSVSDDEPLPPGSVTVEILTQYGPVELEEVVRITTGGAFVPWKNISFYAEWETDLLTLTGLPEFPDGPGYDVRITVMDIENLTSTYTTTLSYEIKNKAGEVGDDDDEDTGLGLPGWAIASLILLAILVLVGIFLFFLLWSGRRKEKDVPLVEASDVKRSMVEVEKEQEEPKQDQDDMYSGGGWGSSAPAPEAVAVDESPYEEDIDLLNLDLGIETPSQEEAPAYSTPEKPQKRNVVIDIEDEIDVDLPEGVMPAPGEDWDGSDEEDEWEEMEEEEIEDVDDWEDIEEDDQWEDVEEDDWEDFEEEEDDEWEDDEEEDVLTVTCKCGEEIEIPSNFKGSKFRCPECGRKGRIPKD